MPTQADIAHQQKLLDINRRNLAHYLSQRTSLGSDYTPPGVANGIREARSEIRRIKQILQGWNVPVEDHPDDEETSADTSSAPQHPSSHPGNTFTGDLRGATISIGNQAGRDLAQHKGDTTMSAFDQRGWNVSGGTINNIAGDMNISSNPNKDELLATLRQLHDEFDKAQDLPAAKTEEMKEDLDSAIKAVDKPQPNKERAVERLTTIQKVLESLKGSGESALALGKLIGQVILAAQGLHF